MTTLIPNSRSFPADLSFYGDVGVYEINADADAYRRALIGDGRITEAITPSDDEVEYARLQGWPSHRTVEAITAGLTITEIGDILARYTPLPLMPRGGREDPRGLAQLAEGIAHLPGNLRDNIEAILDAVPSGALFYGWTNRWVRRTQSMDDVLTIVAAIHNYDHAESVGDAVAVGSLTVERCAEFLASGNWRAVNAEARKVR